MNDHSQPEPEFTHSSASDPESHSNASGMFSHSQQFTVMGGTFTNVTHKNYAAAPSLPSDFRMIPMGDIDLRHPIRANEHTSVAYSRPRERARVRRLYSAQVEGRKSTLTVAMYQGDDAEQEWRSDLAKYMSMRHPNIVQLCGAASSNGIHATIFNDDLISLREILDHHQDSHFSTIYIYAHCNQDFTEAFDYINRTVRLFGEWGYTLWIRRSTGRLCTELGQGRDALPVHLNSGELPGSSRIYPFGAVAETITTFMRSLSLEQYHNICYYNLAQNRRFDLSASTTVNLGAVFHCSGHPLEDSVEIAFLPSAEAPILCDWTIFGGGTRKIMPNGWTRFQSGDVFNTIYVSIICPYEQTWLSQANHIFRRLNIMSNFGDYVLPYNIQFQLNIPETAGDPPESFLFLCPREDFRIGSSAVRWPACPAYWSLDPSGTDHLSLEEATWLGFPSFELTIEAGGYSWDTSVYEGLRQFHEAKGFDPYSQDVARHLGCPLYELSSQADTFAYVDSDFEKFDADIDSDCNSAYTEHYESEYPLTSACNDSNLAADAEAMHHERDVHDPAGGNRGPEPTEISNYANHNASGSTLEEDMVPEETPVPSLTFRIVLYIQLMLISFLALSGVHRHVW
ncbi:hypothetical protein MSAN_00122100 [Mycena sanguinolenta]|uniref:Uncharacterized protein n=1 Tax=Mycena sanguinolenta TaxID=230812 RepID=A0A8H6ZDI3_9AGAR|nr:hypothetical protein MSAN_00122100 [Mycena sanguinolenta]